MSIKKKKNEEYINENKLIISTFEKDYFDEYFQISKEIDNFSNFTNMLINKFKDRQNKKKKFIEFINDYLNDSNYLNNEKYDQYKINEIDRKRESNNFIEKLKNILKKDNITLENKELKLFVELYLKIKNNKKLLLSYEKTNYEDILRKLRKVIENLELMINSTLIIQLKEFSIKVFSYFDTLNRIVFNNNISLSIEDQSDFNSFVNTINKSMNKNYNELITKLDKVYNKTDIKLKNINISCFKYNDSKAAFLNSFDENKKKLNVVLKQYEKSCQKKIKNFKKNCENQFEIFNDLIQNKLKKRYDFLKGNKLSYIFNEYKNNEFQMNISYDEYSYFNEEDWKESFYSKSYKWLNGITVNYFIHDYKKDKKNVSNKLIDAFNKKLKEIKKNILEFSENEYDNIIEKIKEISNIFNIDWDNLRKNKKEILELSENLKNKIREFFGIKD